MMLNKLSSMYIKLEHFITNTLMIGVVIFVFLASVMRWMGSPIPWSVEFATLLFVWVIFLGANRAMREERHIGVDFFVKKFPTSLRQVIEIIVWAFILIFLIYMGWKGMELAFNNVNRKLGNLPMSYSFVTISVPVGCIVMGFTTISKMIGTIKSMLVIDRRGGE